VIGARSEARATTAPAYGVGAEYAHEAIVRLERVSKVYGRGGSEVIALHDVDLELPRGRVVFLMGPSGSGKTTLLSIVGCLLRPSAGRVFIMDDEVSALAESALPAIRRRSLGFVFQSFNLFPALTARENVELALHLRGMRGAAARRTAGELLERVGLAPRVHHLPRELSGGERQRIAVARALVGDPPIMLADEPTASLDSVSGRAIVSLLRELARVDGRLVFIVSHDSRLLDFADEVIYIEDGTLRAPTPTRADAREVNA